VSEKKHTKNRIKRIKNVKDICIFWHQYLVNDWERIVGEQFEKLVKSGLYNACKRVTCGVVCKPDDVVHHKEFMGNLARQHSVKTKHKFKCYYTHENNFEYITLSMLQGFSNKYDAYVLYFHTKGVSIPLCSRYKKRREQKRIHMEKINILRWKMCVEKLNEGNMCCGTNKRKKFYTGNFW